MTQDNVYFILVEEPEVRATNTRHLDLNQNVKVRQATLSSIDSLFLFFKMSALITYRGLSSSLLIMSRLFRSALSAPICFRSMFLMIAMASSTSCIASKASARLSQRSSLSNPIWTRFFELAQTSPLTCYQVHKFGRPISHCRLSLICIGSTLPAFKVKRAFSIARRGEPAQ